VWIQCAVTLRHTDRGHEVLKVLKPPFGTTPSTYRRFVKPLPCCDRTVPFWSSSRFDQNETRTVAAGELGVRDE
jgi:hypothetical protein